MPVTGNACVILNFVHACLQCTVDNKCTCKSGKFRCKNIFVVAGGYENLSYEN